MSKPKLTVIDFFCGAGGFSEGFSQQDYQIIMGIDSWEPAIKTFNYNFGLDCSVKNILDFEHSILEIEALPNTDVIIGSPPCVNFSSSNNSGKADKSSGINLTKIFLKIVAIKKWQPNSMLKAWFMENVTGSIKHIEKEYTFEDLGLKEWAKKNNILSTNIAINLDGNQKIINSADYGCAQNRQRIITGENIINGKLIIPAPTFQKLISDTNNIRTWRSLKNIRDVIPSPFSVNSFREIPDPNYPKILIRMNEITDHFYDSGLYECEWKQSKFLKTNHPYMGKMSFPENNKKPSRTITATKIGSSRESMIFLSENMRKGNGEFRSPTVREAACIMGFPIHYQFYGGENTKWRLVGNAVCPSVGRAFAKQLRFELGFDLINEPIIRSESKKVELNNLNNFKERIFSTPTQKNIDSRFRRHPFKDGNITVTLSNYNINKDEKKDRKWRTSIQYGNGSGFPSYDIADGYYKNLETIIRNTEEGIQFYKIINNGFTAKIATAIDMQKMFELQKSKEQFLEPTLLIEEIAKMINDLKIDQHEYFQNQIIVFENKDSVPMKQLLALYAINKITTKVNSELI